MASTWSKLKIELIGTGEQSGTWGTTTNNNLGSSSTYRGLEQAIVGMATLVTGDFTSNSYTMPYTDSSDDQDFRCLFLNITATLSAAGTVIVPAIQKPYIVKNASVGGFAVTVKVSGQTGVSVPNGALILLYNNGTDVGVAVNYLTSLTLGSALPIASGGTGTTSTTFVNLASNVTGTLPIANGGTGTTSTTFVNLASNVTGTLPIASGGTGQTTYTNGELLIGNTTGNTLTKATLTAGSGVSITNGSGAITISATGSGGTITSVTATSPVASSGGTTPVISLNSGYGDTLNPYASKTANYVLAAPNGSAGVPTFRAIVAADIPTLNQNTTGSAGSLSSTLAVSSGGTGATTLTSNNVILGNGTSAVQFVAPGTNGNVLTSNGTTWTSAAISGFVTTSANNAFTGANTFYNATGQTFAPTSANDGIIIQGRAGGTLSYRMTFTTNTLNTNRTLTFPDATDTVAVLGSSQTFTGTTTFRSALGIRSEASSGNDAIVVAGRAGGASSYSVTLTPTTLSANRQATFPDATGTVVLANGAQTVEFAAGSASAPSITFTGDTNTGIYSPGADRIGFTEGGAQCGEFDSSGNFKFNSGYGSVATAYGCRAWVNFNGTGTVATRGSGNVSSITDNATGNYTVNFSTAMPDTNYAICATAGGSTTFGSQNLIYTPDYYATGSCRVYTTDDNNPITAQDATYINVAIFR